MRALGLVGIAAFLPACADEGITGLWHGELTVTPGAEVTLTISQRDEIVMGSVDFVDEAQMGSEVTGSVKNEWVELEFPQLEGAVHYEAGLQGDESMTGTWTMRGFGQKLTVKRIR